MISGVSFGGESLETLIAKEPANANSKAMASSSMYDDDRFERSGSSFTKKAVVTVGALAVIAGALALLRGKVESLKNIDVVSGTMKDQEGFTAKAKFAVAKAGQKVIDWSKAVWNHIPFVGKKGKDAAEKNTPAPKATDAPAPKATDAPAPKAPEPPSAPAEAPKA